MKLNADIISRTIRGIIGVILIVVGILNQNWIGLFGAFFLLGAFTGGCGFGSTSCNVPSYKVNKDDEQ